MPRLGSFNAVDYDPAFFDVGTGGRWIYLYETTLPTKGLLKYSDFWDPAFPDYYPKLVNRQLPEIEQAAPDLLNGLPGVYEASITLGNLAQEVDGATKGLTISQLLRLDDLWKASSALRVYDLTLKADIVRVNGINAHVSSRQEDARITMQVDDFAALRQNLPAFRTLDLFPSANFSDGIEPDHAPIIPFSIHKAVPLALCHATYIVAGFVLTGSSPFFRSVDLTDTPNYVVQDGDVLVYDVNWVTATTKISIDLGFSSGDYLKDSTVRDQNNLSSAPENDLSAYTPTRPWYRRRFDLSTFQGYTITKYLISARPSAAGTYNARLTNAYILDKDGAIKVTIFDDTITAVPTSVDTNSNAGNSSTITRQAAWDYGPIRPPASGTLTVRNVYRAGRVVSSNEYSIVTFLGYSFIRFTREQEDPNGGLWPIQVDLDSTEWSKNPASVIKFLLNDPTLGLNLSVDTGSFAQAVTDYNTLQIKCGHGLSRQQAAIDVIRHLLLHGAWLKRTATGAYALTVDTAAQHGESLLQLGQGDDRHLNNFTVTSQVDFSADDRIKTLIGRGWLYKGLFGPSGVKEAWLLSTSRIRSIQGREVIYENPHITDINTLDRQIYYLSKRLEYLEDTVSGAVGADGYKLPVYYTTRVHIPNFGFSNKLMEVRARKIVGRGFLLSLAKYDPNIFTYVAGTTMQVDPRALIRTDYLFTPPAQPTNVTNDAPVTSVNSNGVVETRIRVHANAPSVNVSAVLFRAVRTGAAATVDERLVPVTPGQINATQDLIVEPGLTYDLEAYAYNSANKQGFQLSTAALITNVTTPDDSDIPTNVPVPNLLSKTINADGSMDVTLGWAAYSQGIVRADFLMLFWKSGPALLGVPATTDKGVHLNIGATGYTFHGLNPDTNYRFGIAAVRKPKSGGYAIGAVQSPGASPDWADISDTANYTGFIAGVEQHTFEIRADGNTIPNRTAYVKKDAVTAFTGNRSYNLSVYNLTTKAFVSHMTYDLFAQTDDATEYGSNGGFENGFTGWSDVGTLGAGDSFSLDTGVKFEGEQAFKLVCASGATIGKQQAAVTVPTAQDEYIICGWIKCTAYVSGTIAIDVTGTGVDTSGITLSQVTTHHVYFSERFTKPAGTTSLNIRCFAAGSPNLTCYFDEVHLYLSRPSSQLADDMNKQAGLSITDQRALMLYTRDAPEARRVQGGLPEAIRRHGGTRVVFTSTSFKVQSAYVLLGQPLIGEGNGIERYAGAHDQDNEAQIVLNFITQADRLANIRGNGYQPWLIPGVPTNNPVPSALTQTVTDTGHRADKLSIIYTQPAMTGENRLADGFIIYYQSGNTSNPTGNEIKVGAAVRDYTFHWSHDQVVSYAWAAYRESANGIEVGPKQTSAAAPDWQGVSSSGLITGGGIGGGVVTGGTGGHLASLTVEGLNVKDATLGNVKIIDLAAGKIKTGDLLVDGAVSGANKITVKSPAEIEMQLHQATPAKLRFTDSAGTLKSEITAGDIATTDLDIKGAVLDSGTLRLGFPSTNLKAHVQATQEVKLIAGRAASQNGNIHLVGVSTLANRLYFDTFDEWRMGGMFFTAVGNGNIKDKVKVTNLTGTLQGYIPVIDDPGALLSDPNFLLSNNATLVTLYAVTLTPAAVAANTTSEQTFTVTGLSTSDRVYVNKPTHQAGLGIVGARVSAANTLAITFGNFTGSSITPTSESYKITALQ